MAFIDSLPEAPAYTAYTKRYDYDGASNLIYEGWAHSDRNAGIGDPLWAIKAYTYTSTNLTLTQWANGNSAETNAWSARAGLAYK